MKTKLSLVTLLIGLLLVSTALAQKPDFSGTWVFNSEKSQLPEMGRRRGGGGGGTITITHKDPKITMVTVTETQRGERKLEVELTLGGDPVKVAGRMGGDSVYKGYWDKDGKNIIIETEMTIDRGGQVFTMTGKLTYQLSADGKTLTCDQVRTTPRGDMESKLVYDKK